MRILVVSDSHGRVKALENVLQREPACDMIVHLGDGAGDFAGLTPYTVHKQLWLTRGNCDAALTGLAEKHVIPADGLIVLACHGHRFGVNMGLDALYFEGLKEHAALCLYGHTHVAKAEFARSMWFVNPGAAKDGRYGVIDIENGAVQPELKTI